MIQKLLRWAQQMQTHDLPMFPTEKNVIASSPNLSESLRVSKNQSDGGTSPQ